MFLFLCYRLVRQCPPQIRLRVNLRPARLVLRIINRGRWIRWRIAARTRLAREKRRRSIHILFHARFPRHAGDFPDI